MSLAQVMLTTVDNPYDPFDQFDDWYNFDMDMGYNSCAYLARVSFTSDALSDTENEKEIERAIDDIIKYDPFSMYLKVSRRTSSSDKE